LGNVAQDADGGVRIQSSPFEHVFQCRVHPLRDEITAVVKLPLGDELVYPQDVLVVDTSELLPLFDEFREAPLIGSRLLIRRLDSDCPAEIAVGRLVDDGRAADPPVRDFVLCLECLGFRAH